jgi:monoamine oxidase
MNGLQDFVTSEARAEKLRDRRRCKAAACCLNQPAEVTLGTRQTEVIVVGAGVAGLAAARTLRERGVRTVVLEARDRIGGRVFTYRDPRVAIPIELGAEFIHGTAPELMALVREARLIAVDVPEERWEHRGRRYFRTKDFWGRLEHIMGRMRAGRSPDRSLREFLAEAPGGRAFARDRILTQEFVENFHAADALRISERALAKGGSPHGHVAEQRIGRLTGGYDEVVAWLARKPNDKIHLRSVVTHIEWAPGAVRVHSSQGRYSARAVIITLPIGVLQARAGDKGAVSIHPSVPRYVEALSLIGTGPVTRIVMLFKQAFWRDGKMARLSFLQGADADFPVWWTLAPVRAPILVAWAGGRAGASLALLSVEERREHAFAAAARQFGVPRARLASLLVDAWTHDWEGDPFSRGAYSYPLVGGDQASRMLARPVAGTLYLAGEATVEEADSGTVHGAIRSGYRAATQIVRRLEGA